MTQLIENKPPRRALIATLSHFYPPRRRFVGQSLGSDINGVARRGYHCARGTQPPDSCLQPQEPNRQIPRLETNLTRAESIRTAFPIAKNHALRDWLAATANFLVDWCCEPRFALRTKRRFAAGMINFRRLHLRTWLLLPVIVILGPLGNVLLSKGMKGVGAEMTWAPSEAVAIFIRIFSSGYIWLGIASLVTFFLIYMLMLTWADYSYVQPASALSYAVVSLLGYFWLGEAVPPMRWVGIGIICFGVLIIVGTPHRTERESDGEAGHDAGSDTNSGPGAGRDLQGATKV
jgi:uncharacterized membrane protein